MKYFGLLIFLGIMPTFTSGNEFDCVNQNFPTNLLRSPNGMLETIFKLESRVSYWTLNLLISNSQKSLARIIFNSRTKKLTINCTTPTEMRVNFQQNSIFKLEVNESLIKVSQLLRSGSFSDILKKPWHMPYLHSYKVTLDKYGNMENGDINLSFCSVLDTQAYTPTIVAIAIALSIAVLVIASAVFCILRKNKTASQTSHVSLNHQLQEGLAEPNFDHTFSLNTPKSPVVSNFDFQTSLLSSSLESMRLGPLTLHDYSRHPVQESLTLNTGTLPKVSMNRATGYKGTHMMALRGYRANECHKSQPFLAFNSPTPRSYNGQHSTSSHAISGSPCIPQPSAHSYLLAAPMNSLSRSLQEVPLHYSTTGRPPEMSRGPSPGLNNTSEILLRGKSNTNVEDNPYERVTLLFADN